MARPVRIVGHGMTALNPRPVPSPSRLMQQALRQALASAQIGVDDIDGLIAVPSLADPKFMEAHNLGTQIGLLPRRDVIARTIDTGGAGPISSILEAKRLIESEGRSAVAVVAGDAVSSLSKIEFLKRADQSCQDPGRSLTSPVIPHGYDRIAQWQARTYGTTREQFAMCSVLMSMMASRHPLALTRTPHTLQQVLSSPEIAPITTLLECARRADGAAAVILASDGFVRRTRIPEDQSVVVISGAEAAGSLYPPAIDQIDEGMFSCQQAAQSAYEKAQLGPDDIDYFGLYDCFPICLIRAIEAVGLSPIGCGGDFIEAKLTEICSAPNLDRIQDVFPINTHGGLLSFGAPWEAPAMFSVIEAIQQLTGKAECRQIQNAKRALVYGNGANYTIVILKPEPVIAGNPYGIKRRFMDYGSNAIGPDADKDDDDSIPADSATPGATQSIPNRQQPAVVVRPDDAFAVIAKPKFESSEGDSIPALGITQTRLRQLFLGRSGSRRGSAKAIKTKSWTNIVDAAWTRLPFLTSWSDEFVKSPFFAAPMRTSRDIIVESVRPSASGPIYKRLLDAEQRRRMRIQKVQDTYRQEQQRQEQLHCTYRPTVLTAPTFVRKQSESAVKTQGQFDSGRTQTMRKQHAADVKCEPLPSDAGTELKTRKPKTIFSRLHDEAMKRLQRQITKSASIKQLTESKELQGCTFHPAIWSQTSPRSGPISLRLYEDAKRRVEYVNDIRAELDPVHEAPFRPRLNARSRRLARERDTGTVFERLYRAKLRDPSPLRGRPPWV